MTQRRQALFLTEILAGRIQRSTRSVDWFRHRPTESIAAAAPNDAVHAKQPVTEFYPSGIGIKAEDEPKRPPRPNCVGQLCSIASQGADSSSNSSTGSKNNASLNHARTTTVPSTTKHHAKSKLTEKNSIGVDDSSAGRGIGAVVPHGINTLGSVNGECVRHRWWRHQTD